MKKILILMALTALPCGWASARKVEFKVADVFTDHMVLQRETEAPVWGWAQPGAKVTVTPSWNKVKYSCTADGDGRWSVDVATPYAGGPYSLTISTRGEERIVLDDVLSGEVWICTGQSNMEMPVKGFGNQFVEGALDAVLEAPEHAEQVRVFDIKAGKATAPLDTVDAQWKLSYGNVAANTSAVAYFFARRLSLSLGMPVGIICCPWGGSMIEPWMSREYVDKAVKGKIPAKRYEEILARREDPRSAPRQVATMYNARMYPVRGYAARGFLWYQGCGNLGDFTYYDLLQAAMVECWREMWGDKENRMAFMFTALAPYSYGAPTRPDRGYFVENQLHSLALIPNSFAAVGESLGDEDCIHPPFKREIADQFILQALESVYGIKTGIGSGFPRPERVEFPAGSAVQPGRIRQSGFDLEIRNTGTTPGGIKIRFTNCPSGMGTYDSNGNDIKGFEVAGADRVFHPVKATLRGNEVTLDCSAVGKPAAVRYAFMNYCESNLRSATGIPCPSFRTDKW